MPKTAFIEGLLEYIQSSPTAFHATKNASVLLAQNGFIRLDEKKDWGRIAPGSYYVIRNQSSLIAFHLGGAGKKRRFLRMAGAHTDSPGLKLKPQPVTVNHCCLQLGVEVYGGALLNPWFDRDLSLAGLVVSRTAEGALQQILVDVKKPVAIIPSLAIHLDREANNKRSIDKQKDLAPLVMIRDDKADPSLESLLKKHLPANCSGSILDFDLFFYDTQPPAIIGLKEDFITGARLDNLLSCYALLQAGIAASGTRDFLLVLNNHEEIGSVSTTGAQGTFFTSVLHRLFPDQETCAQVTGNSLFVSVDNAHAVHPSFAHRHEPQHLPLLNKGIVLKKNANLRYATDACSAALFKMTCQKAKIPVQEFVMRSDMACGSTIGPVTAASTGISTVDVGVPSLGMHSVRETAGVQDVWYLYKAMSCFFQEEQSSFRLLEPE